MSEERISLLRKRTLKVLKALIWVWSRKAWPVLTTRPSFSSDARTNSAERKVTPKGTSAEQRGSLRCGYNFFWWSHRRLKARSRISCPLQPFALLSVWDSDGQRAWDFQLQTACISKNPFRQSLHKSVTPSLSRYNDSLRRSEVLMPIGYLSRISHTFMYELGSFACGRRSDWIVRSQFSSLTVHFHFSPALPPLIRKPRISTWSRAVHLLSPSARGSAHRGTRRL